MPDHFTAHDRARTTYSKRLIPVEIPDEPLVLPIVVTESKAKPEKLVSESVVTKKPFVAAVSNTGSKPAMPRPLVTPTGTKGTQLKAVLKAISKEE